MNKLYHNVLNIDRLKSILETDTIYKDERIIKPCVYFTRNFTYLSNRGIRMVFDKDKLRYNYKIKPFCIIGWSELNNCKFRSKFDEMEERVLNDVSVSRCCIRIDIDKNKYPNLDFNHPLLNITNNFKKRTF